MNKKGREKKRSRRFVICSSNGTSRFEVSNAGNGNVYVFSGHACVPDIQQVIPVELLTKLLHEAVAQRNFELRS